MLTDFLLSGNCLLDAKIASVQYLDKNWLTERVGYGNINKRLRETQEKRPLKTIQEETRKKKKSESEREQVLGACMLW